MRLIGILEKISRYLPNILSFLRILISPALLFFLSNRYTFQAFILIAIGAMSDFFDGFLARKLKVESKFGEILDPIADKVFCNAVLWGIYAYMGHKLPILLMAVALSARDAILILGGIFIVIKRVNLSMAPVYTSKICTALIFLLAIIAVIFGTDGLYFQILSYICLAVISVTILIYVNRFLRSR